MKDKNTFEDYEQFKKQSIEYHNDSLMPYADRVISYHEHTKEDGILRCIHCGNQKMDNSYSVYGCKECLIKSIIAKYLVDRPEAEKIYSERYDKYKALYSDFLNEHPTIRAIIEYAEENNCMKKQVPEIVKEMKAMGKWIHKSKPVQVSDFTDKILKKIEPNKFIESKEIDDLPF